MPTTMENKIAILGEVYSQYRDVKKWDKFFLEEMVGISLAWLLWTEQLSMDSLNEVNENWIDFAWHQLINGWGIEDKGYTSLNDILKEV